MAYFKKQHIPGYTIFDPVWILVGHNFWNWEILMTGRGLWWASGSLVTEWPTGCWRIWISSQWRVGWHVCALGTVMYERGCNRGICIYCYYINIASVHLHADFLSIFPDIYNFDLRYSSTYLHEDFLIVNFTMYMYLEFWSHRNLHTCT